MTRSRTWTLGTAVLVALVLLAGWFLLVAPTRADAADIQAQTVSQQAANAQLAAKIEQLKVQAQDLPAQEAELARFRQHVPTVPALPSFIRQLSSISSEANVTLVEIQPQLPSSFTKAPAPAASPAADGTTPAAAPEAPTSNLKFIQAQVDIQGGYFNTEQFFTKLEGLKRSYIVTGFDLTGDVNNPGHVNTTLQLRIFYSPQTADTATATAATN